MRPASDPQRQLAGKGIFFSGPMLEQLDPPSLTEHIAKETRLRVTYATPRAGLRRAARSIDRGS
jgi:hypothetical protein